MNKILTTAGIVILLTLFGSKQALAVTIAYDVNFIGGVTWQYDYTLSSNPADPTVNEFTVHFERGIYQNLVPVFEPAVWNDNPFPIMIAQPGSFADLNDGFYDAFSVAGLAPGQTLGLFSVEFDWFGAGRPGSQPFDIVDPNTFETILSGRTSVVPVPAAVWLFATGILGLIGFARRRASAEG